MDGEKMSARRPASEKVLAPAHFDPWGCACMVLSHFSRVQLFATPWAVAGQALPSMGFSRQEYWSGLSCPPPGIFPMQGSNLHLLCLHALAGGFFTAEPPGKPHFILQFSRSVALCNPMDCSPPGSSVHGILQARILEWVAMPSSRGSS